MHIGTLAVASVAAMVLMCGLAPAATSGPEDPRETDDAGQFVEKATQDGMLEVELGKMAQRKATAEDVKAFATRMVNDHGKVNAELASIAGRKNLKVPDRLDGEHRTAIEQMNALSGRDFDSDYAQRMAAAHAQAISLYTQATQGRDAELAAFAKKVLPTLEDHKKHADSLAKAVAGAESAPESNTKR